MASFVFQYALRNALRDVWPTEVVSVKRRTWRTLWLVKRTFRERRYKATATIILHPDGYEIE